MLYPVKNEPIKSYGIVQMTQWFVMIISTVGMCICIERLELQWSKEQCTRET